MGKKKKFNIEEFKAEYNTTNHSNGSANETNSSQIYLGKIKKYNQDKSYGFINYENNKEIFFHKSKVLNNIIPEVNFKVKFIIAVGKKKQPEAQQIEIIADENSTSNELKLTDYYTPKDTNDLLVNGINSDNFNLCLNKFIKIICKNNKYEYKIDSHFNKINVNFDNLDSINKQNHNALIKLYPKNNFKKCELELDSRLIIGLGAESVYETSMTLHHIYGVPYIPGQSIKGIVRSWIINAYFQLKDNDDFETKENKALIESEIFCMLFGCPEKVYLEKKKEYKKSALEKEFSGKVIFLDAFPKSFSKENIKLDIMNPHFNPYYSDKENKIPPADYHNPIPINFLTVVDTSFIFYIAVKNKNNIVLQKDSFLDGGNILNITEKYLKEALLNFGIGSKTAVGYGYFKDN